MRMNLALALMAVPLVLGQRAMTTEELKHCNKDNVVAHEEEKRYVLKHPLPTYTRVRELPEGADAWLCCIQSIQGRVFVNGGFETLPHKGAYRTFSENSGEERTEADVHVRRVKGGLLLDCKTPAIVIPVSEFGLSHTSNYVPVIGHFK